MLILLAISVVVTLRAFDVKVAVRGGYTSLGLAAALARCWC